jgi:hypothetical protein
LRSEFVELVLWKRFHADDHFLYGGSDNHKLRHKQHTELGGSRSDECCHHAGDIHVQIGKRFNQHEPNGDNHLHANSSQRCWFDHLNVDRYRKPAKQTNHQLFHRQPPKHYLRFEQHVELDDERGEQHCHHAGNIYIHIREWFDEHEPNGDDRLHADSNQCRRFDHVDADRYRKPAKQTSHQLFHSQPHKHYLRFQQHVELDDKRGEQHCHHPGNIYIHIRQWFDQRQPNGDDHLHADCDQRLGLSNIHGESHSNSVRRSIGDNNHFVPRWNTRRGVRRLHDSRQRWLSAVRLFRKLEFQLLSVT